MHKFLLFDHFSLCYSYVTLNWKNLVFNVFHPVSLSTKYAVSIPYRDDLRLNFERAIVMGKESKGTRGVLAKVTLGKKINEIENFEGK